ncbi:hypothetical protein NEOLEDRAFT_961810 [Neolentinus lepideus HHB14362 ss-1]|uniref:G-protein coupled receptors family 1 profile domain-containing protein n=1 Tax=Neolentinus lepideus HHB14362 ss-1 TaxID=1314782 RepID=A0A165UGR0_9AGAM|nr:hypothetical protein NEOLEDRAFT_961810 [Neolentinus lepideus HHB14362 ss-1]
MRQADVSFATLQKVNCISLWLGSMIYGCHVVVFAACVYILGFRHPPTAIHNRLLCVNFAAFLFSTAQMMLAFLVVFLVLSLNQGRSPLIAIDTYNILNCIIDALNPITNIIADSLLIWRCYIIWGRRLSIIMLPILLLIIGTVCGYILVYAEVKAFLIRLHAPTTELSPPPMYMHLENLTQYMIVGYYASTFATNILMSALIAYRILAATCDLRSFFGKSHVVKYVRAASIIIETGAIYSLCLLFAFILRGPLPLPAGWIFSTLVTMCASIFPALLTLLVSLNGTTQQHSRMWSGDNALTLPIDFATPQATIARTGIELADHQIELQFSRVPHSASNGGLCLPRDSSVKESKP